jgi:hypothetical protein
VVGGNRIQRQPTRGKVLSRNIWNRVEAKKRSRVKQAISKSES